jgi:hypothetical protein
VYKYALFSSWINAVIHNQKWIRISCLLIILTATFACGNGIRTPVRVLSSIADSTGIQNYGIVLVDTLDQKMIEEGSSIYHLKCAACHRLGDQFLVGPGFSGVTNRREANWILNMIINPEAMLTTDSIAQAMLDACLTRMPFQNLEVKEARSMLEFLRYNDY